jgi:hypothetical protein
MDEYTMMHVDKRQLSFNKYLLVGLGSKSHYAEPTIDYTIMYVDNN